jgi:DNA-binding NarL/FixJ family response regulator
VTPDLDLAMSSPLDDSIRVVTIEDDPHYRASLEALLRHAQGFALVGSFGTPAEALSSLAPPIADGLEPTLVLMDLDLPGMSGIECTRRIKEILPDVPVVVLTVFEDRTSLVEAITVGADGYLLKRTSATMMLEQLRSVVAGGSPLSAGVARTVLEIVRQLDPGGMASGEVGLTPREREVLTCLVNGMSYKAVARDLAISIDTVRSHIRAVYRKLQVNNVAEAVGRALRERLV